MAWRLRYWRGTFRMQETIIGEATQSEVTSLLEKLAAKQMTDEMQHPAVGDTSIKEPPEIRSNRKGTLIWTTGKDFHYTAEWVKGTVRRR
jgi:hypothetical protein